MTTFSAQKMKLRQIFLLRLLLNTLLVLFVFMAPWWLAAILGMVLLLTLGAYETILIGLLLDMLHATWVSTLPIGDFLFTSIFLVAASVTWFMRRSLHTLTFSV